MKNKINKEEIFNQIKQNGCKCYLYGNKNNLLTQSDLIKTIENNKERIINGKIGNSFADVIQDKNNEIDVFMAFKKELKQLLKKYNATIKVDIPRGKMYAGIKVNIGRYENILKQDYIVKAEDL